MNLKTPIGRLRLLALMEGVSFLLFAVTMPLKYGLGYAIPNLIVGFAHGLLFIAYGVLCLQNIFIHKWGLKQSGIALIASLIPAGTFYADKKIFKPTEQGDVAASKDYKVS